MCLIYVLLQECDERLQKIHREEITSQLQANKLTIEAVKSQAEQKRLKDIEELNIEHENDQGLLIIVKIGLCLITLQSNLDVTKAQKVLCRVFTCITAGCFLELQDIFMLYLSNC